MKSADFQKIYKNLEEQLSEEDKKSLATLVDASCASGYVACCAKKEDETPEEYCSQDALEIVDYIIEKAEQYLEIDD